MKANEIVEIEEGLVLNNPTMEISQVNYDWINHSVGIECIFSEENGIVEHSRTFTFSTDGSGELTSLDILAFINNHIVLKVFI